MNGEKAKEIKKALKAHSIEKLKYQDGIKIKELDFIDILTYINELESENERLRLERDVLIGKKIVEKQKYDNAIIMKIDIQEQLKDRIAELEKKIENGTLVELPCKVGDTVYSNERIMFEPLTVKVITIHQSIKFPVSYTVIAMAKNGRGIYLSRDNFNEDWFLTKAEAEKKLKEL